MQIKSLKLINFRNYSSLEMEFNSHINIIIGKNGEGKTNILESIYLLALSKTYRSSQESELIKFNEEISRIEGKINSDELLKNKTIVLSKLRKQLFINGKEIRRNRDYIKDFSVISFSPDDLEIVKGSPNIRRNLLNIDISQLHNNYISYLNEYNHVVKMRNEYLKRMNINGNTDERYLDIINQELINKGTKIYEFRTIFVEKINHLLPSVFKKITGLSNLSIKYVNNIGFDEFDENQVKSLFINKLKKNFKLELMQGMTLSGPHRDDFAFLLDGVDMKVYASQGQQRMAVIALKICEIFLFKDEIGSYPVLLLDDMFSEIDEVKRNRIIKFLDNDIQTIITTTDINDINKALLEKAFVYNVHNNKVTRKGRIKNGRKGNE